MADRRLHTNPASSARDARAHNSDHDLSHPAAEVRLNGSHDPRAAASLEEAVLQGLERYFLNLEGAPASGVYAMVVHTVERPMLEVVLQKTGGNQVRAAEMLGINRNTLRKKLQQHGLTAATLADSGPSI